MKINQEESIKIYLRVKTSKILNNAYYDINYNKNIFLLHNDKSKNNKDSFEIKFDKIFNDEHKNSFIYNQTCSEIIKDCLNGISFCFISHGETLSDKLITLIGDTIDENNGDKYKGIFPRVLFDLNTYINKNKKNKSDNDLFINFSFICVNNNKLIDLNNFIDKDITNFKGDNYLKEGKTIQNDKNLVNYIKKLPINNIKNTLSFIYNNISLFIKLEKENNDNFYSTSHIVIILYITNKKGDNISSLTFILLNGSEKINLVENNINLRRRTIDFNNLNPERKKKSVSASKCAIITQNTYNSIIYLIKQNKKINMNNNFKKEQEENNVNIKESKYISNLAAVLYRICFDWRIKNIKYIIFGNIYPNIGYYKSVKDSIFFLNEFYKIIHHEKILMENKNTSENEDYEILDSSLFELECKVNQQNQTIDALNDLVTKKNKKIDFIQEEYNFQINQLKKSLGFDGDINILLSGNEFTKEGKKAKIIRESCSKVKVLTDKIFELENKLKKSKVEIDKFKTKEKIMKEDKILVKYINSVNDIKDNKENERNKQSIMLHKLDLLEKELKNKTIAINKLEKDLKDKNKIIENFSNLIYINNKNFDENKNNEINKFINQRIKDTEKKNNKNEKNEYYFINNQKIDDFEKLKKEYESKIKEEKDFWTNAIDEEETKLEYYKKKYKSLYEINTNLEKSINKFENENKQLMEINDNQILEIKKYQYEFLKLNEILMNIIHKFHFYFLQRAKSTISLVTIKNNVNEFSKLILKSEESINFTTFQKLHTLLESKNQLDTNYKIIINKTTKPTPKIQISREQKKIEEKIGISSPPTPLSDDQRKKFNIFDNYICENNKSDVEEEIILTKEKLEKMYKYEIVKHCLKLNERIKEIEKYISKYNDVNLENDENKKQVKYLRFKLNNVKNALDEQVAINNKNKIIITSQNRTIDKFYNNMDINKGEKDSITISLSPTNQRKIIRFNKSQANLKLKNDIFYCGGLYNKELSMNNKNNDLFYNNTNKKNKNKINIQLPNDYYSIDSENKINKTKNLYKNNINTKISSQNTTNSKFNSYNDFNSSYINFHSQN